MDSVNPKDRSYVNDLVIQCLRDSMFVLETTRIVHWRIVGSKFYQIHLLTGDIQDEMHAGVDAIASRSTDERLVVAASGANFGDAGETYAIYPPDATGFNLDFDMPIDIELKIGHDWLNLEEIDLNE